jgi:hypothetical protein
MRVNDTGTRIIAQLIDQDCNVIPLGQAITLLMRFRKPDGTAIQKTPVLLTDGSDGKIVYTTISGDIDQKGNWEIQSSVLLPGGSWHSVIDTVNVQRNLPSP